MFFSERNYNNTAGFPINTEHGQLTAQLFLVFFACLVFVAAFKSFVDVQYTLRFVDILQADNI